MGVKLLNTFIQSKFPRSICNCHWKRMKHKKIVVDTNNYMYKFMSEDNLEGGFIRMCDLFNYYDIIPLFIFDGRATEEKREEIVRRKKIRKETKKLYNELNKDNNRKINSKELIELKRKMVRVTKKETNIVEDIISNYGFMYMKAPTESDVLCSKLVQIKKAHACLSEDMDMFIYGCPIILRNYSATNKISVYNLKNILNYMNIDLRSFKYLCIISNLKYKDKNKNIFHFYKLFLKYLNTSRNMEFVDYLFVKEFLDSYSYEVHNNYNYYDLKNSDVLSKCKYILIKKYPINKLLFYEFKQKHQTSLEHFCPT